MVWQGERVHYLHRSKCEALWLFVIRRTRHHEWIVQLHPRFVASHRVRRWCTLHLEQHLHWFEKGIWSLCQSNFLLRHTGKFNDFVFADHHFFDEIAFAKTNLVRCIECRNNFSSYEDDMHDRKMFPLFSLTHLRLELIVQHLRNRHVQWPWHLFQQKVVPDNRRSID